MLEATIFGTFTLSDGTAVLREEDIRSDKLVQLLAYLIIRRDGAVTKKRLSELLCSGNSKNPEFPVETDYEKYSEHHGGI